MYGMVVFYLVDKYNGSIQFLLAFNPQLRVIPSSLDESKLLCLDWNMLIRIQYKKFIRI